MKVYTIEIADVIERELKSFLKDWGGDYPMRFTRFIDLGGKQTDLYAYPPEKGASPWMIIRIKSVMKTDQGECIQVFASIAGKAQGFEEVVVSPENWKLPALADRVLTFAKNDMLAKVGEGGASLPSGSGEETLGSGVAGSLEGKPADEEEDEDIENLDTSGILAGDSDESSDFNPADFVAQANAEGDDDSLDPSELIRRANEEDDSSEDEDKK